MTYDIDTIVWKSFIGISKFNDIFTALGVAQSIISGKIVHLATTDEKGISYNESIRHLIRGIYILKILETHQAPGSPRIKIEYDSNKLLWKNTTWQLDIINEQSVILKCGSYHSAAGLSMQLQAYCDFLCKKYSYKTKNIIALMQELNQAEEPHPFRAALSIHSQVL